MCGIVIALGDDRGAMDAAVWSIRHRGMRRSNVRAGCFRLGRVRLPILGLSDEYDEPYRREGWTINYAGEVVNFRDFLPSARCDVEVLGQMLVDLGPGVFKSFDGFWSVMAVSPNGKTAVVLTDFLAKKPLYYRVDGAAAAASEIRALAAFGPLTADPIYFSSVRKWGYHVGDRTWAREVRKLPAGAALMIDAMEGTSLLPGVDVVEPDPFVNLKGEIELAVRRRVLASDVPVAMLLSGGLDSSIIYRLAKGLRSDLRVYHADNGEEEFLNLLDVTEPSFAAGEAHADTETILRANEGPVDLGSVWPQYALGQVVREDVALSGDGADELFGGYRRATDYDSQGSDVFEELVHYHLPRLDKLMMAGTVELRSPFLARRVVAGALALPREDRIGKRFLKRAFADELPREIVERPKMPLKTRAVIDGGVERRRYLCDRFEDMIARGVAT